MNPREGDNLEQTVMALTAGRGVDKAFECVGREDTFVQAMSLVRKQGLATVVGIFEQTEITIPVMRIVNREIRIQGSQGYCWDFPVALAIAQEIGLEKLVTHRYALNDLQTALEVASDRTQNSVKVVLNPNEGVSFEQQDGDRHRGQPRHRPCHRKTAGEGWVQYRDFGHAGGRKTPEEHRRHCGAGCKGAVRAGQHGSAADRARLVDETVKAFGGVHVLVNNAGVGPKVRNDLLDMTEESWDHVLGINAKGTCF